MSSENRRTLDITSTGGPGAARPTMYDERFLVPMRRELTEIGFTELRTPEDVDATLPETKGTSLVVVNSICGCAARMARPAVRIALTHATRPQHLFTVFAGQDPDATERARSYFTGYPPSSPSVALLRDGKLVWMLERWQIEGRPAPDIADDIVDAFDKYC
jgi:putative YphP/YqiW family bacilliredoxin